MNLTTGQQRLVFAVVVLVLAGLGFWLVSSHNSGSAAAAPTPSASASPSAAAPGAAYVPPTAVPSATPASTVGGGEIYQWLPFSASDLTAAANATTQFAAAYATWSYSETATAYAAKLKPLVTAPELTTLENDYNTPGVAGPRTADKQVSAATSSINSISAFAPSGANAPVSITFVVAISQQVTSTQPATTVNGTYDITVEEAGGGWQVGGIQLSGLGNTGLGEQLNPRAVGPLVIGLLVMLLLAFLIVPMFVIGGASLLFEAGTGSNCGPTTGGTSQPKASTEAADSIPANYLKWFQKVGQQYNVSWTILAGIGEVESEDGRTTLPGVNSGSNSFGAAGPMQIGIRGASGNQWGGTANHLASEVVGGVATDEDGDGRADVYDPADAIAGAAKYLVAHGVQQNADAAVFAYNHADWYVEEVLTWASKYASGGFTVADATQDTATTAGGSDQCTEQGQLASFVAPNAVVGEAVAYAEEQLGKPYLFGGTGPAAFDCSGLTMMAYQAAGVTIPRTSQEQWKQLPHVPGAKMQPGDLVFFAGDGTPTAPGHVGLVIGKNLMIEAYASGTPIRVSSFGKSTSPPGDTKVVGFAQPWTAKEADAAGNG